MAKTLLNGVNEVLKKADVLDSDSGTLADLTDSGKQTFIDTAVQVLNEVVDELYSLAEKPKPNQLAESTITLVTGDQDYALASDLVVLRTEFGLIDETNNQVITVLDDYRALIHGDLDQNDTGLPTFAAIRPTDGELWLDRAPTANENGRVYKYRYDKELELSVAADTFPFGNTVFRAIVPAAAELWKLYHHREFSQGLFDGSMGRAARLLRQVPARDSWMPSHGAFDATDPLSDFQDAG